MLPGMNKLGPLSVDEKQIRRTEAIVLSMTPKERSRPEIINGSRRKRIAKGSGTSVPQVNQLLRQFSDMRKLMRSKGKMKQLMKQMGGGSTKFGF
jgi:signal recognition particle subunit SRP54